MPTHLFRAVSFAASLLAASSLAWAAEPLTDKEISDLTYMREEEKLARDVYRTLNDAWKEAIFANIAESEQTHTDAIATLLDRYKLPDPVIQDLPGVFINPDLQALYHSLVAHGVESATAALMVGALIEETDIRDIQQAIDNATHIDIIRVYEELMRGSRNHLRAFVGKLEASGIAYTAQVLEQDTLDAIVDSPMERGSPKRR
jgi:hypothetical protein